MEKILIIEEQAATRRYLLEGLAAEGFSTISADQGQFGLQQAQEHRPDVITCGITLPDIDGYTVLSRLRQNPATALIPLVFITTQTSRASLRKAIEMGAADYLTKPFTIEELTRTIAVQLEKQMLQRRWQLPRPQAVAVGGSADVVPCPTAPSIWPSIPRFSNVFDFIEENYHQAITLNDVAQAVGYSPAYLTNLVRRRTGQTVQRWIIERRMAAARALLLETNQDVSQIAAQVGYHHVVHFFRQFRKYHGTTPQSWRNLNRMT